MLIFILEVIVPILFALGLIVEVIIPSLFPSLPYFWFIKAFKRKPKEISDAERELKQAMDNMEALKNASEGDKQIAELRISQAQEAIDRIKGKSKKQKSKQ